MYQIKDIYTDTGMCSVVLTLDLNMGDIGDEDAFKREVRGEGRGVRVEG